MVSFSIFCHLCFSFFFSLFHSIQCALSVFPLYLLFCFIVSSLIFVYLLISSVSLFCRLILFSRFTLSRFLCLCFLFILFCFILFLPLSSLLYQFLLFHSSGHLFLLFHFIYFPLPVNPLSSFLFHSVSFVISVCFPNISVSLKLKFTHVS